jgi:hypothetical protein
MEPFGPLFGALKRPDYAGVGGTVSFFFGVQDRLLCLLAIVLRRSVPHVNETLPTAQTAGGSVHSADFPAVNPNVGARLLRSPFSG